MTGWPSSVVHRPLSVVCGPLPPTDNRQQTTDERSEPAARPPYRNVGRGQTSALAIAFALAACGCDPVFDIEGAFFPSWMISLLVGVLLTIALRLLFLRGGIEPFLGPLPLVYTCLALLLTMATWVLFFHV